MLTKSKTKADILSMLDRISAQHGGAMSIPMLRVDQSDHLKLYTCALTTGFLQAMIYCLPPQPGKLRGHSARSGHEKNLWN